MFLYYLDESYDNYKFAVSAIRIPSDDWMAILQAIVAFRRNLRDEYGIFIKKNSTRLISFQAAARLPRLLYPRDYALKSLIKRWNSYQS